MWNWKCQSDSVERRQCVEVGVNVEQEVCQ